LLAQEEMVKLIKENKYSYSFDKTNICNTVTCKGLDFKQLNLSNRSLKYYDYEFMQTDFVDKFYGFAEDVYFLFAPIMVIPLYSQYTFKEKLESTHARSTMLSEVILQSEIDPYLIFSKGRRGFKNRNIHDIMFSIKNDTFNKEMQIDKVVAKSYITETHIVQTSNNQTKTEIRYYPVYSNCIIEHHFNVKDSKKLIDNLQEEHKKNYGIVDINGTVSIVY
jgi:hypothetical protein